MENGGKWWKTCTGFHVADLEEEDDDAEEMGHVPSQSESIHFVLFRSSSPFFDSVESRSFPIASCFCSRRKERYVLDFGTSGPTGLLLAITADLANTKEYIFYNFVTIHDESIKALNFLPPTWVFFFFFF